MNTHHHRPVYSTRIGKSLASTFTLFTALAGLSLGSLGLIDGAQADVWDNWDEDESNLAPMISPYQSLRKRTQDAFDELEEELGERPRRSTQEVKRTRSVKKVKRVKSVTRRRIHHSQSQRQDTQRSHVEPSKIKRPAPRPTPSQRPSISTFESRVLELVNRERARGGDCGGRSFEPSHPLRAQVQLAKAAQRHAHAMAEEHFFDHKGTRGDTPKSRIDDSGYQGRAWGENIAAGQRSPESVVRAWMKSPGHCRNILNPLFHELGVSFTFEARSPYKTYWVQAFGTPL